MNYPSRSRKVGVGAAVFAGLLLAATAASAHVEITADEPPGSDDVVLTSLFAENECTGALQTVELVFPDTPDLTTATPTEVDGWTSAVTKRDGSEAAASIVWTNTAGGDGDGEFKVALGPIATDQEPIEFKALQTCADGEVFRWIESAADAEFPAPVLAIDHSGHTGQDHAATDEPAVTDAVPVATKDKKSDDDSSTGVIIGVVAGVVVLGGAGAVLMARRKK